MTFPCPGVTNCQVRLDQAHINLAELLLQPVAAPPGFIPEDSMGIAAHTLLVATGIPLQRSPIGPRIDPCFAATITCRSPIVRASLFENPPSSDPVAINVTGYALALLSEDVEDDERPASTISVLSLIEPSTFGFAAFQPGPRLRLVLTAAVERPQ
jgi:hypothetical protein